jgi:hypothetical protein
MFYIFPLKMVRLSTETCRDTIKILYQGHFVSSVVQELVFDHIFSVTSRAQCGQYCVLVGVPICFQNHMLTHHKAFSARGNDEPGEYYL